METESFDQYDLLVVPALYAAPESLLQKINDYVAAGGHLFTTFKTGFTDENEGVPAAYFDRVLAFPPVILRSKQVKLVRETYHCEDNELKNLWNW